MGARGCVFDALDQEARRILFIGDAMSISYYLAEWFTVVLHASCQQGYGGGIAERLEQQMYPHKAHVFPEASALFSLQRRRHIA